MWQHMDTYEQDIHNNMDNGMEIMRTRESKTRTTPKQIYKENINEQQQHEHRQKC